MPGFAHGSSPRAASLCYRLRIHSRNKGLSRTSSLTVPGALALPVARDTEIKGMIVWYAVAVAEKSHQMQTGRDGQRSQQEATRASKPADGLNGTLQRTSTCHDDVR